MGTETQKYRSSTIHNVGYHAKDMKMTKKNDPIRTYQRQINPSGIPLTPHHSIFRMRGDVLFHFAPPGVFFSFFFLCVPVVEFLAGESAFALSRAL